MGMHCLKCGGQLAPDTKEPLCGFCKNDIAKEVINRNPIWALRVTLEALADTINDLKADINNLKELQKEIIEAIKQKP
jgi:cell division protein FtsB